MHFGLIVKYRVELRMIEGKKGIYLLFVLLMIVFFTGCGKEQNTETDIEEDLQTVSEETAEISENDDISEDSEISDSTEVIDSLDFEELTDVEHLSDNKYTCSYDNIKHDFIVFLPEKTEDAPFVIMLHGYGESGEGFCSKVHFEEEACGRGYAVIYVDGASNPNDATSSSGWNSGIASDGNDDVAFLSSLAVYLQKEYSFSKDKVYAVGFSNGAFMTHRLAMEASGIFSGVVSVAGKMPESIWNSKNETNDISFFQITGDKDDVVPKNSDGSAKHTKDPAIEDVMDYWAASNGLEHNEQTVIGKGSVLTKYSEADKETRVWNLQVKDGRHSWPEESLCGFDMNSLILEFLN